MLKHRVLSLNFHDHRSNTQRRNRNENSQMTQDSALAVQLLHVHQCASDAMQSPPHIARKIDEKFMILICRIADDISALISNK